MSATHAPKSGETYRRCWICRIEYHWQETVVLKLGPRGLERPWRFCLRCVEQIHEGLASATHRAREDHQRPYVHRDRTHLLLDYVTGFHARP